MLESDGRPFRLLGVDIPTDNEQEPISSHSELLQEAFNVLSKELGKNGNTPRFHELRAQYAARIATFWSAKKDEFDVAKNNGLVEDHGSGPQITQNDETLTVFSTTMYDDDDTHVLHMKINSPTETGEFTLAVDKFTGVDEHRSPPKAIARRRTDPDMPYTVYLSATFRGGKINLLERTEDIPDETGQYVRNVDALDCSSHIIF